jgi:hypothetical protein
MGVYRLDEVFFPARSAKGRFIVGGSEHEDVAIRYTEGFQRFVGDSAFDARKLVQGAIAEKRVFRKSSPCPVLTGAESSFRRLRFSASDVVGGRSPGH